MFCNFQPTSFTHLLLNLLVFYSLCTIVNGIVFLVFFLPCALPIHTNPKTLYIELLSCYLAELIYYFQQLFVDTKERQFYLFFFSENSLYSSSCLIALTRITGRMLDRSGKSRHFCLFPGFRGKHCFLPFSIIVMLAVGLP